MDRVSDPVGYRLAKALLSRPLRRAYDIEVEGDARLPDGPVVLAANHRSFMDSIFLALVVNRPVSFLAKAEYFARRRTAWIFRSTGQIPLWRGDPGGARRAIDAALRVLEAVSSASTPRGLAHATGCSTAATSAPRGWPRRPARRSCPSALSARTRSRPLSNGCHASESESRSGSARLSGCRRSPRAPVPGCATRPTR